MIHIGKHCRCSNRATIRSLRARHSATRRYSGANQPQLQGEITIQVLTSKVGLGGINHLVLMRVERVHDLVHDGCFTHTRLTAQQAQSRGMQQTLGSAPRAGPV
jgi:hypothetical protein